MFRLVPTGRIFFGQLVAGSCELIEKLHFNY